MARGPAAGRRLIVYRSGDLYLVTDGDQGRLVPTDGRRPYPRADLQSILAHGNVQDPWGEITAGTPLPAPVAAVVAGWKDA